MQIIGLKYETGGLYHMVKIRYNDRVYKLDEDERFPMILFYGEDKDSFVHQNAGNMWQAASGDVYMDYRRLAHNHKCLYIENELDYIPLILTTDNVAVKPEWIAHFNPFVDFVSILNSGYKYQESRLHTMCKLIWQCISKLQMFSDVDKDEFYLFMEDIVRFAPYGAPKGVLTFTHLLNLLSDGDALYNKMISTFEMVDAQPQFINHLKMYQPNFSKYCQYFSDGMKESFATERFLEITDTAENLIEDYGYDKVLFIDYGDDKDSDKNMLASFFASRFVTYMLKFTENADRRSDPSLQVYLIPDNLYADLSVVRDLSQTCFMPIIATERKELINNFTFNYILFGDDVLEEEREEILNSMRVVKGEETDITVL